jgi:hypothetical protein
MHAALGLKTKLSVTRDEFLQAAADGKLDFMAEGGDLGLHSRNSTSVSASTIVTASIGSSFGSEVMVTGVVTFAGGGRGRGRGRGGHRNRSHMGGRGG